MYPNYNEPDYIVLLFSTHVLQIQSNLCITNTLGTPILWPLLIGGRCSELILCYKTLIGAPKWRPLQTGGR